eukprot:jgi/Chrzof1/15028/Cz09g24150.t1
MGATTCTCSVWCTISIQHVCLIGTTACLTGTSHVCIVLLAVSLDTSLVKQLLAVETVEVTVQLCKISSPHCPLCPPLTMVSCSCTAMGAFKARHYINSVRLID